jgi:anaerobic C4-dicarboxylate transporter
MTSSPGLTIAWIALKMPSVAPVQTVISSSASTFLPCRRPVFSAIACRKAGTPGIGAYWLAPFLM